MEKKGGHPMRGVREEHGDPSKGVSQSDRQPNGQLIRPKQGYDTEPTQQK